MKRERNIITRDKYSGRIKKQIKPREMNFLCSIINEVTLRTAISIPTSIYSPIYK